MKYLVGTRGSQLSLVQTNWVISELQKKNPDAEFEIKTIKTKYGTVRVKISKSNNQIQNVMPEYEDCARIAKKYKIPLKKVYGDLKGKII